MGLDVYLYRCEDRAKAKAAEKADEEYSDKVWQGVKKSKDYSELTDKERTQVRELINVYRQTNNLDEYGGSNLAEKIEKDSVIDPEHYFKIGYFRSSYNGGGFDAVMNRLGLATLWEIFDAHDGEFTPDWHQALDNVNHAIKSFEKYLNSDLAKYDVMEIQASPSTHVEINNEQDALKIFSEELKNNKQRPKGFGGSYSNHAGKFFLDKDEAVKAVAFIPGKAKFMGDKSVYVVYETDDKYMWYLRALKIVRETIQYVLAQKDPQNYYMYWSG
jgi:hypothetical protein